MGDHDVPHLTVLSVEDQECIHVRMTGPGPQSFINIYIIIQDSTSSVKTKGGVGGGSQHPHGIYSEEASNKTVAQKDNYRNIHIKELAPSTQLG